MSLKIEGGPPSPPPQIDTTKGSESVKVRIGGELLQIVARDLIF